MRKAGEIKLKKADKEELTEWTQNPHHRKTAG